MENPLVTEIQRFSLQDGPGIRTTIFLKGCPLRCPWCHNPETQKSHQELYFYKNKCSSCGRCVDICPANACVFDFSSSPGRPTIYLDREKCLKCMTCVSHCLKQARSVCGVPLSMDEIVQEVLADVLFYKNSGGGVTISGGDPLLHPNFCHELATRLRREGVHVAVETSCFPKNWSAIEPLLEVIDLFIVDLKSLDAIKHESVIRWPLSPILANLDGLFKARANVRLHIPFIPGFNDSSQDINAFVSFITAHAGYVSGVDILSYHCHGEGKYRALGRTYAYEGVEESDSDRMHQFAQALRRAGIPSVTIGGLVGVNRAVTETSACL